jgi:hypothetical protein
LPGPAQERRGDHDEQVKQRGYGEKMRPPMREGRHQNHRHYSQRALQREQKHAHAGDARAPGPREEVTMYFLSQHRTHFPYLRAQRRATSRKWKSPRNTAQCTLPRRLTGIGSESKSCCPSDFCCWAGKGEVYQVLRLFFTGGSHCAASVSTRNSPQNALETTGKPTIRSAREESFWFHHLIFMPSLHY